MSQSLHGMEYTTAWEVVMCLMHLDMLVRFLMVCEVFCMYVYIHTYIYIYIYIYMCVYIYIDMCVCLYIFIYVRIYIYIEEYIFRQHIIIKASFIKDNGTLYHF